MYLKIPGAFLEDSGATRRWLARRWADIITLDVMHELRYYMAHDQII